MNPRTTPHWSEHWRQIETQLAAGPGLLLACDFDGTLAPIVPRPEDAVLSSEVRLLLRKLASCKDVRLAVISGRSLSDVRRRVGIEDIYYSGNHGLELFGPGLEWCSAEALGGRAELATALPALRRATAGFEGVIIEDKRLTASVHWRLVPVEQRQALREAVTNTLQSSASLRLFHGKCVWELRPRTERDKGAALRQLLTHCRLEAANTACLGDDQADETMFRAAAGAVTMRVGCAAPTAARFRLNDIADVAAFLFCLLGARLSMRQTPAPAAIA